ncbi:MAG: hypothetical protein WCA00_05225 [Candidatus Acidiferrales bacterium]
MFARGPSRTIHRTTTLAAASLVAAALFLASCQALMPLDTSPLDHAGLPYDTIKKLKSLHITAQEIPEIVTVHDAGFSDADCIELVQISHTRHQQFTSGDAISTMHGSGMPVGMILALANLNQLGLGYGELQAMYLAGLSDDIIMEVARRHAANQPVLSGASLGNMRNLRMNNVTLLELVRRGIPNSAAPDIIAMRRHGASDAEILRHFPAQ